MVIKSTASRSVEGLVIQQTIDNICDQLDQNEFASSAMRASIEVLFLVVSLLLNRSNLNNRNSSMPPTADPNRMKPSRKKAIIRLVNSPVIATARCIPMADPDFIEVRSIDR
jgi:transposase